MLSTTHPFGYEYEVLYPGVRRLFGHDDRLVLEAERDGKVFVIEDFGVYADYGTPEFEDVMDEQVVIHEFPTEEERDAYLVDQYVRLRPWLQERIGEARRQGHRRS